MPPSLLRLTIEVPTELADTASALLMMRGLPGFEVQGDDDTCTLITWVEATAREAVGDTVRDVLEALGCQADRWELAPHADEGWLHQLRDEHPPMQVGPLHLRALAPGEDTVHATTDDLDGVQLALTPGLAFGAGRHPTTALCLEALVALEAGAEMVVDVGCGSGILALAALRLGAHQAWGMDVDPAAVQAALHHAQVNGLEGQSHFTTDFDALPEGDLVLANITPPVLDALAENIAGRVAPGGTLMLCGLREAHVERLVTRYTGHGLQFSRSHADEEGWRLLLLVAPAEGPTATS
ncbi:MAG: 50S ribosomal protein L11 methyltransferase [Bradymonadia bacterium]